VALQALYARSGGESLLDRPADVDHNACKSVGRDVPRPWTEDAVVKKIVFRILPYLLAFGLFAYAIWSNGPGLKQIFVDRTEPLNYGFLALGAAVLTVSVVITFLRWYVLVRAVGLPFTVGNALGLGAVGFFYNTILPGSIGGDLVKAVFLAREQARRTVAVATVVMDRVIALWALIWFVAISGSIFWATGLIQESARKTSETIISIAVVTVVVTLLLWVLLGLLPQYRADRFARRLEGIPRVGGSLAELWRAFWVYRCQTKAVAGVMVLSWIGHVGFVVGYYCCVRTVVDSASMPDLTSHFLLVPIGLVIQAAVPVPGGVGVGELSFGGLYWLFGKEKDIAVAGKLVERLVFWSLGLIGYIVYLQMRPALQAAAAVAAEEQKARELVSAEA
jgi:uncharacterized protein (TIRG00374 family)